MIKDSPKPPKVIHQDNRDDTNKFHAVLHAWTEEMKKTFKRHQIAGKRGWDDPKYLLPMRKQLAQNIKEGMLERKDQEVDISLLSMFVWYCRLTDEEREAIIREWG